MAARQDEPVTVGPVWIGRIVLYVARPQHVREWCECHWRPGVARVRLLNGIHRQNANCIDARLLEFHWSLVCHLYVALFGRRLICCEMYCEKIREKPYAAGPGMSIGRCMVGRSASLSN